MRDEGNSLKPNEIQFAKNLDALKSPQCRRIVKAIFHEARSIPELSSVCKLTPGSLLKHLDILISAGLIELRESNGTTSYSLRQAEFQETQDWFLSLGS